MASPRRSKQLNFSPGTPAGETATCYLALCLVALVLVNALREGTAAVEAGADAKMMRGGRLSGRRPPCEEIYVVGEGETLHTISDKCGDPFIVERNPHIHDPDDRQK
ncbi:hypothetical protein KSP39_PZI007787 [Platanthera zijinensis]|uniref:LysM domain-containing protein n=1 Tax=Platanthera zijinensis TaxID=2320716 RepID=A0AAP0BP85_9ASPA